MIWDRLSINQPFTTKHWNPVFFLHHSLLLNFCWPWRCFSFLPYDLHCIGLRLYVGKCGTVENAHFEKCLFPNSAFVLRLLTAHELVAPFLTNTYGVSGPNFARRCIRFVYDINTKLMNFALYAILAHTEDFHSVVNGTCRFMHRRSHMEMKLTCRSINLSSPSRRRL